MTSPELTDLSASLNRDRPVWHNAAWMARQLDRSEDWVRRAANRGELPHRRDGRRLRFTEDDVTTYLEQTAVPSRMGRSRPKGRA